MVNDISKKTVLVILLIAIVVSVVGTWTVLDAASTVTITTGPQEDTASGQVRLTIGSTEAPPAITGGMIALNIV